MFGVLLVPFPFYLRLMFFHLFQVEHYDAMYTAVEPLGLQSRTVIRHLGIAQNVVFPLHYTCLVVYIVSAVCLGVFFKRDPARFTNYIVGITGDLKHIEKFQCVKLFALHIAMPFQKFGCVVGLPFALIYWPVAFPVLLVISVVYCVPTFYLCCRVFRSETLAFVERLETEKANKTYQAINKNKEPYLINDNKDYVTPIPPMNWRGIHDVREYSLRARVVIGVILLLCLLSILMLYAECFRFLIELATLTVMGAMINFSTAGKFFMVTVFVYFYSVQVFHNVTAKYQTLANELFDNFKSHLEAAVVPVVNLKGSEQKSVAFKFFSKQQLDDLTKTREANRLEDPVCCDEPRDPNVDRLIIHRDGNLHWSLYNLVFFVDKDDIPRIPKALFDKIASKKLRGAPGPVYKNLFVAFKQLSYMIVFLFFVVVVVFAFGDAYSVSSPNQLLLTVVGGLVPFVFFKILKPPAVKLDLDSYAFKGSVHNIIEDFCLAWPMDDIAFTFDEAAINARANEIVGDNANDEAGAHGSHCKIVLTGVHIEHNTNKDSVTIDVECDGTTQVPIAYKFEDV